MEQTKLFFPVFFLCPTISNVSHETEEAVLFFLSGICFLFFVLHYNGSKITNGTYQMKPTKLSFLYDLLQHITINIFSTLFSPNCC